MIFPISKKNIKWMKKFLVNKTLHKFFLLSYIICFPLILVYFSSNTFFSSYKDRAILTKLLNKTQFHKIESIDKIYEYVENTILNVYFPYKPVVYVPQGAFRMVQHRLQRPEECYTVNTDSLESSLSSIYSSECNGDIPQKDGINLTNIYTTDPCYLDDCLEYITADLGNDGGKENNFNGYIQTYPNYGLEILFDQYMNKTKTFISGLKTGNWIDNDSRSIFLDFTFKKSKNQFFICSLGLELIDRHIINNIWSIVEIETKNFSASELIAILIIAVFSLFYTFKTIYEISSNFSVGLNLLELLNEFSIFAFITTRTFIYEYQKEVADIGDNYNEYINYWKLISIVHIQIILLSILCLLFPFRVLTLFSYFANIKPLFNFIKAIYRLSPAIIAIIIILLAISLCFIEGLLPLVNGRDIYATERILLLGSFFSFGGETDKSFIFGQFHQNALRHILLYIVLIIKFFILIIIIATVTYLFSKAASFQNMDLITPEEKKIDENINELMEGMTKILNHPKLFGKQINDHQIIDNTKRLLLWVTNDDLEKKNERKIAWDQIHKMENTEFNKFRTAGKLIKFLRSLFQLKPNLTSSHYHNSFRIIVENLEFSDSNYDTSATEILTDYLKGAGSNVPVLLFTKVQIENMNLLHIQRKYFQFFVATNTEEVIQYSKMESLADLQKFLNSE